MRSWGARRGPVGRAALALLAAAACSPGRAGEAAAPPAPPVATVEPPPAPPIEPPAAWPPPVTTPPVPPPSAPPPVAPDGVGPGAEGEAVKAVQGRLVALRYDPGPVDGRYGGATAQAVMAFQKVTGLPRTGRATPEVVAALIAAGDPAPLLPDGGATRIEIDLARQVLFFFRDGSLVRILPISAGNGKRYCESGRCGVAVTPSGSYRVERRVTGRRRSYLGVLFNPVYFKGGYAIHGSPSVPARPASHGCVRIPMHASLWFHDNVGDRTPVYITGGKHPALPLPPDPPPPAAAA